MTITKKKWFTPAVAGVAGVIGIMIGAGSSGSAEPAPAVTVAAEPVPAVTVTADAAPVEVTPQACLDFIADAEVLREVAITSLSASAYIVGEIFPGAIEAAYLMDADAMDSYSGEIEAQTAIITDAGGRLDGLTYQENMAACQGGA